MYIYHNISLSSSYNEKCNVAAGAWRLTAIPI